MNINKDKREKVSALVDGELSDASVDAALGMLRDSGAQKDWEIYHHIGDVLRSKELAEPLSAGFAARMAARLDAEAPHIPAAPRTAPPSIVEEPVLTGGVLAVIRRYLLPGMAGTAALVLAVMMTPQWTTDAPGRPGDMALVMPASTASPDPRTVTVPVSTSESREDQPSVAEPQIVVSESDIVRDPRIDHYLMAHQRFSPSAYSSSQFARSATFATGADK